ncbi:MAG: hypothetical protein KTR35_05820 [Gammaproteobacteria bacterium]|nr:hypothetical protein [Gammaproteobacteria bacterium]
MKHNIDQQAAIIGGGVIGGGWAARFLLSGWDVNIHDPDPEAHRKINDVISNARQSLPQLTSDKPIEEGTLTFSNTLESAVDNATWIQESVPERLDVKQSVFAEIEQHANEQAIVASSTSGFKPSQLREKAKHPERLLVAHPFNPVYLLPLVELVGSPTESTTTVERRHIEKATFILKSLGMKPLRVRKEIDAHIADRFLEAVWREALWLIKDDVATTEEIDDAIRFGFGLRWAQMGLFETYRVAGGEAGMAHFIEQFGPCLSWPWTKLMDVPELDDDLVNKIAKQSDEQSGSYSIRELEAIRDKNLVEIMQVLKNNDWGAGAHLNEIESTLKVD